MGILSHRGKLILWNFGQRVSRSNTKQTFEFHTAWIRSAQGGERKGYSLIFQGILGNGDSGRDELLC